MVHFITVHGTIWKHHKCLITLQKVKERSRSKQLVKVKTIGLVHNYNDEVRITHNQLRIENMVFSVETMIKGQRQMVQ